MQNGEFPQQVSLISTNVAIKYSHSEMFNIYLSTSRYFTGNNWCIQQKLYDKLLSIQKHFPHMGPWCIPQQGVSAIDDKKTVREFKILSIFHLLYEKS